MTEKKQWFIKTQSGKSGPFKFKELQYFADRGKIKPNTAISDGDSSWLKAKRVDGLYFPGEPPPQSGHEEPSVMPDSAVDGFMTQSSPFGIAPRESEFEGVLNDPNRDESASDIAVRDEPSRDVARQEDPAKHEPRTLAPRGETNAAEIDHPTVRASALSDREVAVAARETKLAGREAELATRESEFSDREAKLARRESTLRDREAQCDSLEMEVRSRESEVACRESDVEMREAELGRREAELRRREARFLTKETESAERKELLQQRATEQSAVD